MKFVKIVSSKIEETKIPIKEKGIMKFFSKFFHIEPKYSISYSHIQEYEEYETLEEFLKHNILNIYKGTNSVSLLIDEIDMDNKNDKFLIRHPPNLSKCLTVKVSKGKRKIILDFTVKDAFAYAKYKNILKDNIPKEIELPYSYRPNTKKYKIKLNIHNSSKDMYLGLNRGQEWLEKRYENKIKEIEKKEGLNG